MRPTLLRERGATWPWIWQPGHKHDGRTTHSDGVLRTSESDGNRACEVKQSLGNIPSNSNLESSCPHP
jgi:hypothetical protein